MLYTLTGIGMGIATVLAVVTLVLEQVNRALRAAKDLVQSTIQLGDEVRRMRASLASRRVARRR
jgi:hypothetical protein